MRKHFLVIILLLFTIPIQIKAQNQLQNDESISSITNHTTDSCNGSTTANLSVTTDTETETGSKGNMNIPIILGIIVLAVVLLYISKRTKKTVSNEISSENQNFSQPLVTIAEDENPNEMELLAIATTLHLHIQGGHETEPNGFYLKQNPTLSPWAAKSFNFKKTPIKIK
ncbi:MAG: hypothetical protein WC265_07935 [Dysgonamonadaceae bacterium]|jgi:hypothetical protein|nr:MAG: hypothetical protein BWY27_01534 [Bacteroidetes bacterium ADurb.Bin234]